MPSRTTAPYDTVMRHSLRLPDGTTQHQCPWHGPARGDASAAPPRNGCECCWVVYYLRLEAVTPAGKREELMDTLCRVVEGAVKCAEKGNFDLIVYPTPRDVQIDLLK